MPKGTRSQDGVLSTTQTGLVAYLYVRGFKRIDARRVGASVVWRFDETPELKAAVDDYEQPGATVNLRNYNYSYHRVKQELGQCIDTGVLK